MNLNSPLQLVKQFFGLIVMIVLSGIRAGDDHNDIVLGLGVEIFVSYRGFQKFSVFLDPAVKVKWRCGAHTSGLGTRMGVLFDT
jgi:hypothetical protein